MVDVVGAAVATHALQPAGHREARSSLLQSASLSCKRNAQLSMSGAPLQKSAHGLIDAVFSMPTSHVAWQREAYAGTAVSRVMEPTESSLVWQ